MTGVEAAIGHVCGWLAIEAQRVQGGPDGDQDPGLAHLHMVVCDALGEDPALRLATEEAAAPDGTVTERTRRRLTDALDEAVERDAALAAALRRALAALRDHPSGGGPSDGPPAGASAGASATGDGIAIGGDVTVRAHDGSVAAVRMGDVRMMGDVRRANPPVPGPPQG